jgi:hypothetical protein
MILRKLDIRSILIPILWMFGFIRGLVLGTTGSYLLVINAPTAFTSK